MTDKLNWGYKNHDFSALKKTLMKYYPIENPDGYSRDNIKDFNGLKDLEKILKDNFFIEKNYKERWSTFKRFLKKELKKPVQESMIAYYPCYSGIITLQEEKYKNLLYVKELHFFISLLGPYYTIVGIDKCTVILQESPSKFSEDQSILNRGYESNLATTVSPYLEFEEPFQKLQEKILKYFPDLRFIPHQINLTKAEGISLVYPDPDINPLVRDSVFSGLFQAGNGSRYDYFGSGVKTRGDAYFGFDEWLIVKKPDKSRIGNIKKGLLMRSMKADKKISVNKVWKLQTSTRITGVSLLFHMQILVLDLSDPETATIVSNEDEEPTLSEYLIVDNEIQIDVFKWKVGFEIKQLDKKELKLTVYHNFHNGEKTMREDLLEMTFEIYK